MRLLTLALLLLFAWCANAATTFTEFYVIPTANGNTNSGHTTDNAPTFQAASGNWTNSTATFFKSGLNPTTGGVTNGAWAAIYLDACTTNAAYIAVVTNHDDTADTIMLDIGKYMGTIPAHSDSNKVSISVGGAWAGPNTGTMANGGGFPFNFVANTATNSAGATPRVNFKTNTYSLAAAVTHSLNGPIWWEGFAASPGDGGRAVINGPTTGAAIVLFTISGAENSFKFFDFANNGNSSANTLFSIAAGGQGAMVQQCSFSRSRGYGFSTAGQRTLVIECEAMTNGLNNGAVAGIYLAGAGSVATRCISYGNTNSNVTGFNVGSSSVFTDCIAYSNGKHGFDVQSTFASLINCDAYNNGTNGFTCSASGSSVVSFENCNAFKNGNYGFDSTGSLLRLGRLVGCAVGTGAGVTNVNGNISSSISNSIYVSSIDVNALPWVDAANGNFRIAPTSLVRAAGHGTFYQSTVNSPTNTVSFRDIGAAQSVTNAATTAGGSYTWSQ